jgi:hypothetical protein
LFIHILGGIDPQLVWLRLARRMGWLKRLLARIQSESGMTTAEYAVGTVAAVAFAVVLYKIVRSPAVAAELSAMIRSALHAI